MFVSVPLAKSSSKHAAIVAAIYPTIESAFDPAIKYSFKPTEHTA